VQERAECCAVFQLRKSEFLHSVLKKIDQIVHHRSSIQGGALTDLLLIGSQLSIETRDEEITEIF